MTSEEDEEENEPEKIRRITHKKYADTKDHYGVEMEIKGEKFTIDIGSPVTSMPEKRTLNKMNITQTMKERYRVVKKNDNEFLRNYG